MAEVRVHIRNIEKLKTGTGLDVEVDKNGEVVDQRLITKISFEVEATPQALFEVHRLLVGGHPVDILIGSPQAIMEVANAKEPAFAEP